MSWLTGTGVRCLTVRGFPAVLTGFKRVCVPHIYILIPYIDIHYMYIRLQTGRTLIESRALFNELQTCFLLPGAMKLQLTHESSINLCTSRPASRPPSKAPASEHVDAVVPQIHQEGTFCGCEFNSCTARAEGGTAGRRDGSLQPSYSPTWLFFKARQCVCVHPGPECKHGHLMLRLPICTSALTYVPVPLFCMRPPLSCIPQYVFSSLPVWLFSGNRPLFKLADTVWFKKEGLLRWLLSTPRWDPGFHLKSEKLDILTSNTREKRKKRESPTPFYSFSTLSSFCSLHASSFFTVSHYFSPSFCLIPFLICLPVSSSTCRSCHYMLWAAGSLHAYEPPSFSLSLSCFPGSHTLRWRDNTSSR